MGKNINCFLPEIFFTNQIWYRMYDLNKNMSHHQQKGKHFAGRKISPYSKTHPKGTVETRFVHGPWRWIGTSVDVKSPRCFFNDEKRSPKQLVPPPIFSCCEMPFNLKSIFSLWKKLIFHNILVMHLIYIYAYLIRGITSSPKNYSKNPHVQLLHIPPQRRLVSSASLLADVLESHRGTTPRWVCHSTSP